MNGTLFLAEQILVVLGESNQTLESQLAASEIVVGLLKAEPYGTLAHVAISGGQTSDAPNRSHSKPCTGES